MRFFAGITFTAALLAAPVVAYAQTPYDAMRAQVQKCWLVDQGAASARVTVTLGMDMSKDGKVMRDSLELVTSNSKNQEATDTAFEYARRAILRCEGDGYGLPPDQFDQWKRIEMTFNPERMRIR